MAKGAARATHWPTRSQGPRALATAGLFFLGAVALPVITEAANERAPGGCPSAFHFVNGSGLSGGPGTSDTLAGVRSAEECCGFCASRRNCTAWTYHPAGGHSALECSLWELPGAPHTSAGAVSAFVPQPPTPPPPPPTLPPVGPVRPPLGFQPNIVLIQTDDQDIELDSLTAMPKLRKLIGDTGATHAHWYVNTPVCCPSRTETLSGRYHHNVRDADGPEWERVGCGDEPVGRPHTCGCMRVNTSRVFEDHHYGDYLRAAGYRTGYFGKYLNPPAMDPYCHNKTTPVPGWSEFYGMCVTAYYNIPWVNSEGNLEHTGSDPSEYSTSIVGNKTVDFIRRAVQGDPHAPFFVSAATRAPHGPQTPAPWYTGAFPNVTNLRTPAYNATGTGHVPWLQDQRPLSDKEASSYDKMFADRWRTLLSVDDLVEAVVGELDALGVLDKTFVFYTSDHGFHLGHLRLGPGKSHFYEFDSRVPMLIRGPGVAAASAPAFIAGNVDLAPTFLALAGVSKPVQMDGKSVLPMLLPNHPRGAALRSDAPAKWRTAYPIEYSGLSGWPGMGGRINDCPNNTYRSLRIVEPGDGGSNAMVSELTTVSDYDYSAPNFHEYYNVEVDRYQLSNGWGALSAAEQQSLLARVRDVWTCAGDSCP